MEPERLQRAALITRLALVLFVLVWLFGPAGLRSVVPVWLAFLVALGLEVQFAVGAWRAPVSRAQRDRGPQEVDRDLYGYDGDPDEFLLVDDDGRDLWVPYAGEEGEELEQLIARERERVARAERAAAERARRRPLRSLLQALAVFAALGALVWVVDARGGWRSLDSETKAEAQALFSREAARIAGHAVNVSCDERGEYVGAVQHADGLAFVGGTRAFVTPQHCYTLYRLAFDGDYAFAPAGRAIAVLAHEAWHLHGVADEGTTQCYALQSGVGLGVRLGLDEGVARRMMRQQLAENALVGSTRPEYLVPESCRNGSRLDLSPRDGRFP